MSPDASLARAVEAAASEHAISLVSSTDGVDTGVGGVITWADLQDALGSYPVDGPTAPDRLASWLKLRHRLASIPLTTLVASVRLVAYPRDHPLHPGEAWVTRRIPGGALNVGTGVRGLDPQDPARVVTLDPSIWRSLGIDPQPLLRPAEMALESSGAAAAVRMRALSDGIIEGDRDADAVTLLASATFRAALAKDHQGMATVAMPSRDKGWVRLSSVDPAFVPPASMSTTDARRGFTRLLLVTAEEVVLAKQGRWTLDAVTRGELPTPDLSFKN